MVNKNQEYWTLALRRKLLSEQIAQGATDNETLQEYTDVCRKMAALYDEICAEGIPV